ncbi:hypothetical protein REJC140_01550 [Pseudorhizobium endolithicum]|uniref:DUF488 domain-containing protein n=1 Tax=Pseudorhizobium endolithicum TaxID=1191678 RepID=A0ABM8PUW2_9HYPH|nr:DUF488 domain-containing protein [Pseudorhizobium endolithicum]CAD7049748.1 hypothetical protein REJC140_01550 [Pseudorhizobium endolithicum]
MQVSTIGFTRTSAEHFFGRIRDAGVKKVIDVRLHNTSQLAAFAKADDLPFFLKELCGAGYVHEPLLAPTEEIMTAFKKEKGNWETFRHDFLGLMSDRKVETRFKAETFDGACLLCSEDKPHHCHRSLVCDYLNARWGGRLSIRHL